MATVTVKEAAAINARVSKINGVNWQMLESAMGVPDATFLGEELHPETFEKAALLLVHLAKAHAFSDGNKRTAWVATFLFLKRHGIDLRPMSKYEVAGILEAVVTDLKDANDVAAWLKINQE